MPCGALLQSTIEGACSTVDAYVARPQHGHGSDWGLGPKEDSSKEGTGDGVPIFKTSDLDCLLRSIFF